MTARYVACVLALAAVCGALAATFLAGWPTAAVAGVIVGLGLSAAGTVSWILLTAWSVRRGNQAFMAAAMLGILGRLVIYSATLIYVALRTSIDLLWMAGALLGFHLASIALEVRYALVARRAGPDAGTGNAGRDDGR